MRMQFYMRLKDIPELATLKRAERYRMWFQCVRHSPRSRKAWLAFFVAFIPFAVPLLYPVWWMFFVVVPVLSLPLIVNWNQIQVEELRPYFREQLARRA